MNIIENYMQYISSKSLTEKTMRAYYLDIRQFLHHVPDYINANICDYIEFLSTKLFLKQSSIKRKIVSLRAFYEYLVIQGYISKSPFDMLNIKIKQEVKKPKTLSVAEIAKLLKCFDIDTSSLSSFKKMQYIRDAALIDLLISTGIRIEEASYIMLNDVLLNDQTLLIRGRDQKQRLIYISSSVTWKRILTLFEKQKSHSLTNYLFTNRYDEKISTQSIEKLYSKYIKEAKINTKSTPCELRHTFATNLLANGADLQSVQEILGHSNVSSTQKYTEKSLVNRKQVLQKFNYRNNL